MEFDTLAVVDEPSLFQSSDQREAILAICRSYSVIGSKEPLHGKDCFLLPLSRDDATFTSMTRRIYDSQCSMQFLEIIRTARNRGASFVMLMVPAA